MTGYVINILEKRFERRFRTKSGSGKAIAKMIMKISFSLSLSHACSSFLALKLLARFKKMVEVVEDEAVW